MTSTLPKRAGAYAGSARGRLVPRHRAACGGGVRRLAAAIPFAEYHRPPPAHLALKAFRRPARADCTCSPRIVEEFDLWRVRPRPWSTAVLPSIQLVIAVTPKELSSILGGRSGAVASSRWRRVQREACAEGLRAELTISVSPAGATCRKLAILAPFRRRWRPASPRLDAGAAGRGRDRRYCSARPRPHRQQVCWSCTMCASPRDPLAA